MIHPFYRIIENSQTPEDIAEWAIEERIRRAQLERYNRPFYGYKADDEPHVPEEPWGIGLPDW